MNYWQFETALPSIGWPAFPNPHAATTLGLLHQLEVSQWMPPDEVRRRQSQQLEQVLRHAFETVPFYRQAWSRTYDGSAECLYRLPLLHRRLLQDNFDALKSERVPNSHGPHHVTETSGSTGTPVRVVKTGITTAFWNAITLRDHVWHRRDLSAKLASVRHAVTPGRFDGWGAATAGVVRTGPSVVIGVRTPTREQLRWLITERPAYLMTYPSIVRALALETLATGAVIPELREVRTFGEWLPPDTRDLCLEAWNAPLVDLYSSQEVGYIALQCPESGDYHVQSEDLIVEIVDDQGRACADGQPGRIVVTTLHNFAMPLVRYDIGDIAAAGPPCRCGRGLPVLQKLAGRYRNMLITRSGERYWPTLGLQGMSKIAPTRQHQFAQLDFETIEARLVVDTPLTDEQERALTEHVLKRFPAGFRMQIRYCDAIPRGKSGKFEDFVCELPEALISPAR
jgi:phenylacetate-CoA ligase